MKETKILIPVTNGSDEISVTLCSDILRRAEIIVTVAKCCLEVPEKISDVLKWKSENNINFIADAKFEDIIDKSWDAIILPPGKIANIALSNYKPLIERLKKQKSDSKLLCAIGDAPAIIFPKLGLLPDENSLKMTCSIPMQEELQDLKWETTPIVTSGKIITCRSAGSAFQFSIHVASLLTNKKKIEEVKKSLLLV